MKFINEINLYLVFFGSIFLPIREGKKIEGNLIAFASEIMIVYTMGNKIKMHRMYISKRK